VVREEGIPSEVMPLVTFYETKPNFSEIFPRNSGDLHVYGNGRWEGALGLAGGLEALEFVQGLEEASLYRGLVAGELRESVALVGIRHEGVTEHCRISFLHSLHL
jgi:hypothetical protein